MTKTAKIAIVLGGYALAVAIGLAGEQAYELATPNVDRATYSGMSAFGDSLVFLGAFGLAALAPTGAALWFLRGWRPFWLALTALAAASTILAFVGIVPWVTRQPFTNAWLGLAPIRAIAAPLFALAAAIAALIAPSRGIRIALFAVAAGESLAFLIALIFLRSG